MNDPNPHPVRVEDLDMSGLSTGMLAVWIGVAVFVVAMLWLFGSKARARRRMKRGTQQLVDRELVTLTGVVRQAGAPLAAPLTGKPCVAFQARARLFESYHSTHVTDTPVEIGHARFVLELPQGPILVEGDKLVIEAVPTPLPRSPGDRALQERTRAFLAKHGFAPERIDAAGFDEIAIEPGELVTVHGMIVIEVDPHDVGDRGYREAGRSRMRIVPPGDQSIVVVPV